MKILLTPNKEDVIFNGIISGFKEHDHELIDWNHKDISMSDMLYRDPDIKAIIIASKLITDTLLDVCKKNKVKTISYGPNDKPVDIQLIHDINPKTHNLVSGQHYDLKNYVSNNFYVGGYDEKKKSDLLVISNYKMPKSFYHELLNIINHFDVKIIGRHSVGLPQYLGATTIEETMSFVGSTKVVLDYDGNYVKECIYHEIKCVSDYENLNKKHIRLIINERTEPIDTTQTYGKNYEPYSELLEQIL